MQGRAVYSGKSSKIQTFLNLFPIALMSACGESASFKRTEVAVQAEPVEKNDPIDQSIFRPAGQNADVPLDSADGRSATSDAMGRSMGADSSNQEIKSIDETSAVQATSSTLEKSFYFEPGREKKNSRYDIEPHSTTQTVLLSELAVQESMTFDQISRPMYTRDFRQGNKGTPVEEIFDQEDITGILDVLVVVDNSGSMTEEQTNLSTKLSALLSEISDTNWKIGIVTTDPQDSCMRGIISKGQARASEHFLEAVSAGISGSGNEQGVRQAVTGLSCPNSPWLRQTSSVAVLIVSDEDNCSRNGGGCQDLPWGSKNYLKNYLTLTLGRQLGKDARVYGLIKHPTDTSCQTGRNTGTQYAELIKESEGTWGSICANDYTQTLSQISKDMKSILKKQFALKNTPDGGSLQVQVTTKENVPVPAVFSVSDNIISFSAPPPLGAKIKATYTLYSEPQLKEFSMGSVPAPETLRVTVNDIEADPRSFETRGNKVIFRQPPPPSSRVVAVFREDLPLLKSFSIGSGAKSENLQIFLNETRVPESEYIFDASSGMIIFARAPQDAAKIRLSFVRTALQDTYPLLMPVLVSQPGAVQPSNHNEVTAFLFDRGAERDVTHLLDFQAESIKIKNVAQFQAGQTLLIKKQKLIEHAVILSLPPHVYPDSISVISSLPQCRYGQEIVYAHSTIKVTCNFTENLQLTIHYETPITVLGPFTLDAVQYPEKGTWKVSLNGNTKDPSSYIRAGNSITLKSELIIQESTHLRVSYEPETESAE